LIIVKEPHCDVEVVTSFLRQVIPDVVVDQNIGSELSYSLSEEMSYRFPDMFEELERRKEELGIASYGASITTMEEVFMRQVETKSLSLSVLWLYIVNHNHY
jgi:ATP-binding cassette subfamily A (ABC1) protein 3